MRYAGKPAMIHNIPYGIADSLLFQFVLKATKSGNQCTLASLLQSGIKNHLYSKSNKVGQSMHVSMLIACYEQNTDRRYLICIMHTEETIKCTCTFLIAMYRQSFNRSLKLWRIL